MSAQWRGKRGIWGACAWLEVEVIGEMEEQRRRVRDAVDPVENPTMARQQAARIF